MKLHFQTRCFFQITIFYNRILNNAYNGGEGYPALIQRLYFYGGNMKKKYSNESEFQADVVKELYSRFPDCMVYVNDGNYIQGFPDVSVFFNKTGWATLECKKSMNEPYQPNQEYYIRLMNQMSYSAMICPENAEIIFYELERSFKT